MTKILITGANGFVGKRLIVDLLNQGHQIYWWDTCVYSSSFSIRRDAVWFVWGCHRLVAGYPDDVCIESPRAASG